MRKTYRVQALGLLLALLLAACGGGGTAAPTSEPAGEATAAPAATEAPAEGGGQPTSGEPIAVGSKNFTEAILVAEMYALMLEDAGFTVERTFNLGSTQVAHPALVRGDIDLYPEYTSTGLLEVLKLEPLDDAAAILEAVRAGYEEQFQATWLEPSPFNNTNALAMTRAKAEELGIRTYSDLVPQSGTLRLGGPPEFPEREDTKGLVETYGFDPKFTGENFMQYDTGTLRYEELLAGNIDVVVAFRPTGRSTASTWRCSRTTRASTRSTRSRRWCARTRSPPTRGSPTRSTNWRRRSPPT